MKRPYAPAAAAFLLLVASCGPSPLTAPSSQQGAPEVLPDVVPQAYPDYPGRKAYGLQSLGVNGLIPFQSNRNGSLDIYIFDRSAGTVFVPAGVNTSRQEHNPRLSADGTTLVFQSNRTGSQDILLYDMNTRLILSLRGVNTRANEIMPDLNGDGTQIVYVSNAGGTPSLHLYNRTTGDDAIIPTNRFTLITWPFLTDDATMIAFGARVGSGNQNVFLYDLTSGGLTQPPYINSISANEYNPCLSADKTRLLFTSDRNGDEDIFETDLSTGATDNLFGANSSGTEQAPRYDGSDEDTILFQSNAGGRFRVLAYNKASGSLDTLSILNRGTGRSQLRDSEPDASGFATPSPTPSASASPLSSSSPTPSSSPTSTIIASPSPAIPTTISPSSAISFFRGLFPSPRPTPPPFTLDYKAFAPAPAQTPDWSRLYSTPPWKR